ncbi:hypothetical protein NML43_03325 [Rhodopseudomonas palustris]|uniref:hypothetical protein n=1 Tax=Rhodopseudomonas TaxID=1073 RepID=UPI0006B94484|nr:MULTISPECIES: hypothetical protein [Rhodopseudomonas]KPG00385.1 hypothetical protein IP86_06925 [Rhodopseudomonas sp. AAP120]MCP9626118.1 hypothetical protein [Rhodopseudomonas palustris]
MTTVFIAGSLSISRLDARVRQRIATIAASDLDVVVGDADGADTSIQACLAENAARRVTVYCSGNEPRNNVGGWAVRSVHPTATPGSRAFFTAKDLEMARVSDVGLMIWDSKSTGTLSNVIELLDRDKKTVVFVNKMKDFVTVGDVAGLEHLLTMMSNSARAKAEDKVGLGARLQGLSQKQLSLAI